MANLDPNQLKREAIVPLPASRRLSYVLVVSVMMVGMTASLDALLWGVLNRPVAMRREAVRQFELSEALSERAQAVEAAQQLQDRVDMLSAALATCEATDTEEPAFATPCLSDEVTVHVDGVQTLCMPASELSRLEPLLVLGQDRAEVPR